MGERIPQLGGSRIKIESKQIKVSKQTENLDEEILKTISSESSKVKNNFKINFRPFREAKSNFSEEQKTKVFRYKGHQRIEQQEAARSVGVLDYRISYTKYIQQQIYQTVVMKYNRRIDTCSTEPFPTGHTSQQRHSVLIINQNGGQQGQTCPL